jgi:hypothetical protein
MCQVYGSKFCTNLILYHPVLAGMHFLTHPHLPLGERKLHEFGRDIPAQVRIVDARHEPVTGLQEAKVCGRWCLDQNGTHWRKHDETEISSNVHTAMYSIISAADMIFLH